MKVFSKYNLEFNKYPVQDYIGLGLDGEVFSSDNKVIKFVEIKDSKKHALNAWYHNKRKIEYILDTSPDCFVKIYDFGLVKVIEENYSIIYFYLMEKLNPITKNERDVFFEIFSNDIAKFNQLKINYKDVDKQKVDNFVYQIKKCKLKQTDINPQNIMKDIDGNFKFIDLERLKYD